MELSQGIGLCVVTLAAAFLPGLGQRLRVPSPVVEILFGILIGKSLFNLDMGGPWLPFLAELGFLILMFQAGMEINFTLLRGQGKKKLLFQGVLFGATFVLALMGAALLGRGMFIALVLTTTSLGLVMPVLKESGQTATPFGQTVLLAATLADFLTLLGITLFVLVGQNGFTWELARPIPLFAGFALVLWAARLWAWWHPEKAEKFLLAKSMQEQGVRLSLALLFLFVGLSELAHLEPVLGAFMGGSILSFMLRKKEALESKISVLGYGFLTPIFFIYVGMEFDVANIVSADRLAFVAVLLAMAVAVKLLPCMLFPLVRMRLSDGLRAGLLLSTRLSLIIAAASLGVQQGYIDAPTKDSIVLLALLTCLFSPILFRALSPARPGNGA